MSLLRRDMKDILKRWNWTSKDKKDNSEREDTLDGIYSRLDNAEEKISELEDRAAEKWNPEKTKMTKTKQNNTKNSELWDNLQVI